MGRQVGIAEKEVEGWAGVGESQNFSNLVLDFLHREKKMQLHVPSQPFQASVVCKNEGVVVGSVACGSQHSHTLC